MVMLTFCIWIEIPEKRIIVTDIKTTIIAQISIVGKFEKRDFLPRVRN